MSEKYNGWTNYETWNIALWLDQDAGGYWQEQAEELARKHEDKDDAAHRTATDAIKERHDEEMEEMDMRPGPYQDLLNASLREVNWREIAEGMIEEAVSEAAR